MQLIGDNYTVECADGVTRENVKIWLDESGRINYEAEDGQMLCDDCAVTRRGAGRLYLLPHIADFIFYQQRSQ